MTVGSAIFQIAALMWYGASFLPGGRYGMKIFTMMKKRKSSAGCHEDANVVVGPMALGAVACLAIFIVARDATPWLEDYAAI